MSTLQGPSTAEVCCFCGKSVEHTDSEHIRISARWEEDGNERTQSWGAHHACLLDQMHDGVKGQGPFFGD